MKTILSLIAFLFFLIQADVSFSKKKTPDKNQNIEESEINNISSYQFTDKAYSIKEEIERNIEILKFDFDRVSRKKAINFLYDHLNEAFPILEAELQVQENEDFFLSNILTILMTAEKDLKLESLIDSSKKNLEKPYYTTSVLTYIYKKQSFKAQNIILELLHSESITKKITAINLIKSLEINDLKAPLITSLLKEQNPYLIFIEIESLCSLKLVKSELEKLVPFFSSQESGIPQITSKLFSNYPDLFPSIQQQFKKSDYYIEKMALLETVSYYNTQEAEQFLIQQLRDDFFRDKAVDGFFLKKKASNQSIINLTKLSESYSSNYMIIDSISKIFSFIYEKLDQKDKILIIDFFKNKIKNEEDENILFLLLSNFFRIKYIDQDLTLIFYSIQEKFKKSWRIQKMILQILDLKS